MESPDDDEDKRDMADLVGGRDSAMNGIMRRWQDRLISFLVRMVGDSATACDLAQETFVRLYRHKASYNPRHSFSTWLFSIAANLARNHHRWRKRHPEALSEPDELAKASPPASDADPHQRAVAREQFDAVRLAITQLPQAQREVLILSVYEHLSYEEIAEITDSTVKGVELRLYRARQALREMLSEHLSDTCTADAR